MFLTLYSVLCFAAEPPPIVIVGANETVTLNETVVLPTQPPTTPAQPEDSSGLGRDLIIVITVCVIVVVMGVGAVAIYVISVHHKHTTRYVNQPDLSFQVVNGI